MDATALKEFPPFADLTEDERAEVASSFRDVAVEAGTALAIEGDNAYQLFVIESGNAEVRQNGELLRTLGPGDIFGEVGLLATGTRTATVVATSPMRLAAMFIHEFNQLERRIPRLAWALQDLMAERGKWRS